MRHRTILPVLMLCASILLPQTAPAAEVVTGAGDQHGMTVTIYNQNLALVHDQREVSMPAGIVNLVFRDVSAQLQPESAFLRGKDLRVLEQNFDYDLLTPESLLARHLGKEITILRSHPTTGAESRQTAKVLSVNNGVVLRVGTQIETGMPGRLAFPGVPENLRERPALTMQTENANEGKKQLTLSYLTEGLSWQADYQVELAADGDSLTLNGWATLHNESGIGFRDARLQLLAGQLHQVPQARAKPRAMLEAAPAAMAAPAPAPAMAAAAFDDFHLYTVGRPTTIGENQRKQVALLSAAGVPCRRDYVIQGEPALRHLDKEAPRKVPVGLFLLVRNDKGSKLGSPLPAGTMRVFRPDTSGTLQLVGEDRIEHTREDGQLRLRLGNAFDVSAERRQTSFNKVAGGNQPRDAIYECGHEIVVHNARAEEITVQLAETLSGDWKMLEESAPHRQESAGRITWQLKLPAHGSERISYRVRATQ
ncbi:MAG: hypothetical protein BWK76_27715 [Desulfobulbaceae bacterium A2]|nr:MAG: hypothetical protein BWK76_27715 [Desulfobulbaceae bacterium A2]